MEKKNIEHAFERTRDYLVETPLLRSQMIDDRLGQGHHIFFKCENFQVTRSYKPRGALNALLQKGQNPKIARSSGNFAQALSWAGSQLKIPVTIVMPSDIAKVKIEGTKRWGANVILSDPSYESQNAAVEAYRKEHQDIEVLSPYDDLDIIAGQGTVGLEALRQAPPTAHFLGPIGGGGLMGGCATYVKETDQKIETIGVEPEGASDYAQSRITGKKVSLEKTETIAEGLRTPCVGNHNWPLLNKYVDSVITVSDQEIIHAMKLLFDSLGIVTEPSGAAAMAALLKIKPRGNSIVIISGGNIDPEQFIQYYLT